MLQTNSNPESPVVFISQGDAFRESLTPTEEKVYDAVMSASGRKSKKEIGENLGMSASLVSKYYWQAHAKHLKHADREVKGC